MCAVFLLWSRAGTLPCDRQLPCLLRPTAGVQARFTAAALLKSNVHWCARASSSFSQSLPPQHYLHVPYLDACCLAMLQSGNRALRHAAGSLATALLLLQPIDQWPELVRSQLECAFVSLIEYNRSTCSVTVCITPPCHVPRVCFVSRSMLAYAALSSSARACN